MKEKNHSSVKPLMLNSVLKQQSTIIFLGLMMERNHSNAIAVTGAFRQIEIWTDIFSQFMKVRSHLNVTNAMQASQQNEGRLFTSNQFMRERKNVIYVIFAILALCRKVH